MNLVRFIVVAAVFLSSAAIVVAQPDDVAELAKNPVYMEKDVKPAYKTVTAKQLQDGVKVISGRGHAVFGFNTPEIQIHFPAIDNNVFAQIKFADATLFDADGNEVPYEREDGFYTHDDLSTETRFASTDGESLVEFARARGTVTVRYPSKVRTISVKSGDAKALAAAGLAVEGPLVRVYDRSGIVEEGFGSPIQTVRAYDASGRRLQKVMGYSSSGSDEDGDYFGFAFHGVPARLDADVVEEWIGLEFAYDLPPVARLPENSIGIRPARPAQIADTPGGKVTSKEVRITPPEVLGWYADQPREYLEEQLREYGYPAISADALMSAAAQGEISAMRILFAAGISPDGEGGDMTPLISAAAVGQNEAAMLLIQAGANVNAVDMNNSSALLWATQRCGNADLVRALIKAGADVNVQARGSATPMMMATVMNCAENQKILKEAGAKEWKPGQ